MELTYQEILDQARSEVSEVMPRDVEDLEQSFPGLLLIDVREPGEFRQFHIHGSINVPRGVLEQATEPGYDETETLLAGGRHRAILVVCRSGNRSLLAAQTLQKLGFCRVYSLQTGIKQGLE